MGLLQAINGWIDPNANLENFFNLVWNILATAAYDTLPGAAYGLDVWGRIVNIPRTLTITGIPTFGFAEAGDRVGFDQGPFWEAGIGVSFNYELTNAVYRQLILAKAAYNITNGSIPAINSILMNVLFVNRGTAYVTDGANALPAFFGFGEPGDRLPFDHGPFCDHLLPAVANMTLTYVFDFPLAPSEVAIVKSGVLPKPSGVQAYWVYPGGAAVGAPTAQGRE